MSTNDLIETYNELMQDVVIAIQELTNGEMVEIEELLTQSQNTIYSVDDENVYYDTIRANQTSKLRPPVQTLLTLIDTIMKFKGVPTFEFKALKQMSEKEQKEMVW